MTDALVPFESDRTHGPEVWVRGLSAYWRSSAGPRFVKLFLTVVGHSLYDHVGSAALRGPIDRRRSRSPTPSRSSGARRRRSVPGGRLTATLSGLLLEFLVTDNGSRADAGFELLVEDPNARSADWSAVGISGSD